MLARLKEALTSPDRRFAVAAWLGVFVGVVVAYYPGLAGPFVLDDYGSLARLGDFNGVRDWETFKAYVFQGTSGPTGRPLALVTFLIDGTNWPTEAWPFKRTNLIFHLANGVLVGWLISRILGVLEYERRAVRWISLIAAATWLLHPFLVSTVLYPVQRMAQMSTLFMLAGLVVWVGGRMQLSDAPRRAYLQMTLAIVLFGILAIISKENGILMPVLVGVLEVTVFANKDAVFGKLDRRWSGLFLAFPFFVILAYLGSRILDPNFFEIVPPRDFSIYERMLTQPRVIVDYLYHWFFPKLYTTGVFQDHFVKSTSLASPISTLVCMAFVIGLIVIAVLRRRDWPLLSLAILFFFASHLLESTVVNLELYFEHRNYMAAIFLFLPAIAWAYRKASKAMFAGASTVALLILAGFTNYSSNVWSSIEGMVQASAAKAPTSARAQTQYANLLFNAGHHEAGMQVLDTAIATIPGDNALLLVNRLIAQCKLDQLGSQEFARVSTILSGQVFDVRMLKAYNEFAKDVVTGDCASVNLTSVLQMFENMLAVDRNAQRDSIEFTHIKFLIGYTNIYLRRIDDATAALEDSLESNPGASYAMAMAALLASNAYPEEALRFSDMALAQLNSANNVALVGQRATEADIRAFQQTVRADLRGVNSDPQAQ